MALQTWKITLLAKQVQINLRNIPDTCIHFIINSFTLKKWLVYFLLIQMLLIYFSFCVYKMNTHAWRQQALRFLFLLCLEFSLWNTQYIFLNAQAHNKESWTQQYSSSLNYALSITWCFHTICVVLVWC